MKICENFVIEIYPASGDGEQDFLQKFTDESFLQEILEGYNDDYGGAIDKGCQDEAGNDQKSLKQIEVTCSLLRHVRGRGTRSRKFILIGKAILRHFSLTRLQGNTGFRDSQRNAARLGYPFPGKASSLAGILKEQPGFPHDPNAGFD